MLAMITPTAQTIVNAWQGARHFGGIIRGFGVRFGASKAYLNHSRSIFLTKNESPGINGMLCETLPESKQRTIFDMLEE